MKIGEKQKLILFNVYNKVVVYLKYYFCQLNKNIISE